MRLGPYHDEQSVGETGESDVAIPADKGTHLIISRPQRAVVS